MAPDCLRRTRLETILCIYGQEQQYKVIKSHHLHKACVIDYLARCDALILPQQPAPVALPPNLGSGPFPPHNSKQGTSQQLITAAAGTSTARMCWLSARRWTSLRACCCVACWSTW